MATRCRLLAYICSCEGSGLREAKCAVESCCSCRWSCCSWLNLYCAPSVRYSFQAGFLRGVLLVVDGVETEEDGTRKLALTLLYVPAVVALRRCGVTWEGAWYCRRMLPDPNGSSFALKSSLVL